MPNYIANKKVVSDYLPNPVDKVNSYLKQRTEGKSLEDLGLEFGASFHFAVNGY